MRKIIFILMFLISPTLHAEEGLEIIAGFEKDSDLPVLNNELRKLDQTNQDIDERLTTVEAVVTPSAASQSEQETATSTTVYVSPGRQQYHPSSPKGWCKFDGAATGTHAVTVGYNVTSVTRNSTGNYTVTWATDFSTADYVLSGIVEYTSGSGACIVIVPTGQLAGSINFTVRDIDNVLIDTTSVQVVAFGDQ